MLREVKEETGYDVIPESIRPFGEIEEKRLSVREPMIWHQINRLYFCAVDPKQGQCDYSENGKRHGFHRVFYTMEDALEKNERMLENEGPQPWNQREYKTLLLLKEHFSEEKRNTDLRSASVPPAPVMPGRDGIGSAGPDPSGTWI